MHLIVSVTVVILLYNFYCYRQDELKDGKLVGEDSFGNKYFENPRYFYSRNRWVEYSDNFNMNYDGSQVSKLEQNSFR